MRREDAMTIAVRLTGREAEVLRLLARGHSYARIAACLGMSANTVATHVKSAYRKLDVHNAAAAVMRAIELGLLAVEARTAGAVA
jgi:LuxR family maltose regulon positive regulatory protein